MAASPTGHGYWQAVYAFQKVVGLPTSGKADPATRRRLASAARPKPASAAGDLIEVDKARQVLMVVRGGQAAYVFNASSGTEGTYTYQGVQHQAHTPEGRFAVIRQVDGYEESHLGRLYRPKYFHPNGSPSTAQPSCRPTRRRRAASGSPTPPSTSSGTRTSPRSVRRCGSMA